MPKKPDIEIPPEIRELANVSFELCLGEHPDHDVKSLLQEVFILGFSQGRGVPVYVDFDSPCPHPSRLPFKTHEWYSGFRSRDGYCKACGARARAE